MRRKRGEALPPDRDVRERLLDVATEFFARKGYAATTTREIVSAAHVTKPVLYYYFQNKEGVYLEIMERSFKKFETLLDDLQGETGGPLEGRLFHFCDQVFSLIQEEIGVVRLMYSIYYGPPQGAPFFDFDAVHQRLFDAVQQRVEEGIRKKEFRQGDPKEITWAILGAIHVAMENDLSHPERPFGPEGLRGVLRMVFRGIVLPKGGRRKGERR